MNSEERERPKKKKKHVGDVFFHLLSNSKKKQKQQQPPLAYNNKVGGDDKMHISSKVPLIMDKKHYGDSPGHVDTGMQHPCLVARLMGLESMPVARRKEPITGHQASKAKESRPQKRQKPVTPPLEPLRPKNQRATTQQKQQQMLFSPVKNPSPLSKNAVRTTGRSWTGRDKFEKKVNEDIQRSRNRSIARSRIKDFPEFGSGPSDCPQARAKGLGRGRVESERRSIPNNSKHSIKHDHVRMEAHGASPVECSDIVSFTFSSPTTRDGTRFKNKEAVEKRRCVAKPNRCHKNTVLVENAEKIKSRGPRGNEEVLVLGEIRSMSRPHRGDSSCSDITSSSIHDKLQAKAETNTTAYFVGDGDLRSPYSTLEASFSNDSCLAGSPYRSSSGRKPDTESESSCNNVRLSDLDVDLLDSASSLPCRKFFKENYPSSLLENSISNARLLLGSISSTESDGMRLLSDTIEVVTKGLDARQSAHGGIRKLLFDCTIEDSKCNNLVEDSRSLARRGSLAQELQDEIVQWYSFSGKATNDLDLVQMDFSGSYGTWSRIADEEACHVGVEIANEILNELSEETVMNICNQLLRDGSCFDVAEGNAFTDSRKKS